MLSEEAQDKKTSEFFSTAGSVLGGLLGGKKSAGGMLGDIMGDAGTAARRRGSTSAVGRTCGGRREQGATSRHPVRGLETEVERDVVEIGERWRSLGAMVSMTAIHWNAPMSPSPNSSSPGCPWNETVPTERLELSLSAT